MKKDHPGRLFACPALTRHISKKEHPEAPNLLDDEVANRRLALAYAKFIGSDIHYEVIAASSMEFSSAMIGNIFLRLYRNPAKPLPDAVYNHFETVERLNGLLGERSNQPVSLGKFSAKRKNYELYDCGDGRFLLVDLVTGKRRFLREHRLPKGALVLLREKEHRLTERLVGDSLE